MKVEVELQCSSSACSPLQLLTVARMARRGEEAGAEVGAAEASLDRIKDDHTETKGR